MERLSRAVRDIDVDAKASLIELQAAAQRTSQTLGDSRRDLRDLADGENVSDTDTRRLRSQANALADLQELADVLAQARLSSPRIEAAAARARLAQEDLGSDLDVPVINATELAGSLREARQASAKVEARAAAAKRRKAAAARQRKAATQAQTGEPSAPVGSGNSGGFGYFTYYGPAFQARVPTGSGWGTPSASEPTPGRLFRTNVRGPNGLFVIIDYTPFEAARFGTGYSSRTVVGQTAFGIATRYEFQGGRIPECRASRCVDYIINDQSTGSGFAVLAGGGAGSSDIARTVAESVVPTAGE